MKRRPFLIILISLLAVLAGGLPAAASTGGDDAGSLVIHTVTNLILQLGIILFAARLGGLAAAKIKIPSVIGELLAGIILGPYLLGGISLPMFPHGLFPLYRPTFPVAPELYGFATLASVLLLFVSGLETDLSLFLRFSVAGTVVGIGGVVISFLVGGLIGTVLLGTGLMDPRCLFLGILGTATSVGITARILSERNRIDSPEGVTILAGAIIDDVLGIILLSVVIGIAALGDGHDGGHSGSPWPHIALIAGKAVGIWLFFFVSGLFMARRIGAFLKRFGSIRVLAVLAFGMALLLAGVFEKAGLAMIIGAYIMGITLSQTDLNFVIQEALQPLYAFFVPIFFTVIGMLVNVRAFSDPQVLSFGLIFSAGAILSKLVGCGVPALFLNFNRIGALRIGMGMVPRGEVALIIAGIGLSRGILGETIFSIAIFMTLVTTVAAPPLLNLLLKIKRSGVRREVKDDDTVTTPFDLPSSEVTEFLLQKLTDYFRSEGFFIHMLELDRRVYQIRKDTIFIAMSLDGDHLTFKTAPAHVMYIKTLVYEALLDLHTMIDRVKDIAKPEDLRREVAAGGGRVTMDLGHMLDFRSITTSLKSTGKEGVITELVDLLDKNGKLTDRDACREAVLERERSMSTGMQDGIAIPHGKTAGVGTMTMAVGIKKEGVDFTSVDGKPSRIFIMVLSPQNTTGPHIQALAAISSILNDAAVRGQLLRCTTAWQVFELLVRNPRTR